MGGFGQHLVEHGVLSDAQLEEALRFQRVYGGRMGTVAVDLGYLVVEELAEYLSDFTGVPLPPPAWLESPDAQALNNVPPPVIRRCQALPLRIEGGDLHVAMLDPCDPEQLDFLAMASSRPVVPYVLPERKLLYWLEVHCGLDRPPRFLGMVTRPRQIGLTSEEVASGTPMLDTRERIEMRAADAARARQENFDEENLDGTASDTLEPALVQPSALTPIGDAPKQAGRAEAATEEAAEEIILLDELVAAAEPSTAPWEVPEDFERTVGSSDLGDGRADEPISIRLARLEARLYQSRNRDEVVGLALEIARTFSAASALFVVRGEDVSLFRTSIAAAQSEGDLSVPVRSPSVFSHPAQTGLPFRGQAPRDGIDGRVLEGLGRADVQEILVHPIVIRDRVVNVLFADNGPEPFGETSIGALTALCHTLSGAYERLIAEQKQARSS